MSLVGLVLAGGLGRRLGGQDKGTLRLGDRTLADRAVSRLALQVGHVAISANGDPARFAAIGCPVLSDAGAAGEGPLAGVLAGLSWADGLGAAAVVTVAVDAPFFPATLASALLASSRLPDHGAVATCGGRLHPTFALWPVGSRARLSPLFAAGERRMQAALAAVGAAEVGFPAAGDPFLNINTQDDLAEARRRLAAGG